MNSIHKLANAVEYIKRYPEDNQGLRRLVEDVAAFCAEHGITSAVVAESLFDAELRRGASHPERLKIHEAKCGRLEALMAITEGYETPEQEGARLAEKKGIGLSDLWGEVSHRNMDNFGRVLDGFLLTKKERT